MTQVGFSCVGPTPTDLDIVEYCVLRSLYECERDGAAAPIWTPERLGINDGLWKIAMREISSGVYGIRRVIRGGVDVGIEYDDDACISQLGVEQLASLIKDGVENRIISLGFPLDALDMSDTESVCDKIGRETGIRFAPWIAAR